jgi:putative two-component system response regulator
LTPEELLIIRQHVVFGRDVLQKASDRSGLHDEKFFRMAYELVYSHHERWDGRGYPQGLTGEGIPLAARLMAVADVYDALVSKRVYKEAFSHEEAVRIIQAESSRHFDPAVVEAFLRAESDFRQIRAESHDAASAAASAS